MFKVVNIYTDSSHTLREGTELQYTLSYNQHWCYSKNGEKKDILHLFHNYWNLCNLFWSALNWRTSSMCIPSLG